jgi:isopentenyl-diphosphate Delta-isomerase
MSDKVYPKITAVDENDELIGYYQLFDAIALGLRRRVAYVVVLDAKGNILIQRRSAHVLSPNLLDFSAAGHVNEGQDYFTAAQAEVNEELGLQNVLVEPVLPPFETPGFYNALFKVVVPHDCTFTIDPEEVAKVFWVSYEELVEMIARHPQQFTEPFLAIWPHVCDKIQP